MQRTSASPVLPLCVQQVCQTLYFKRRSRILPIISIGATCSSMHRLHRPMMKLPPLLEHRLSTKTCWHSLLRSSYYTRNVAQARNNSVKMPGVQGLLVLSRNKHRTRPPLPLIAQSAPIGGLAQRLGHHVGEIPGIVRIGAKTCHEQREANNGLRLNRQTTFSPEVRVVRAEVHGYDISEGMYSPCRGGRG